MEVPVTSEMLEEYTGTYALEWENSWTYSVFQDGDRLFYTSTFPVETVELFHESTDTFFVTPQAADSFIFTRDDNGNVNGFRMFTLEGLYDTAVRLTR